jgi:hypothetical protein
MKRYISAVLIPCLLLQLSGCYSFREVTIDEFKEYNGEDDVKIITEQTEFILNRDSTEKNKLNWVLNDSSIILQEKTLIHNRLEDSTSKKMNEIKFNQMKSIAINEADSGKTEGLILLTIVVVAAVTVSLIAIANDNFMTIGN